MFLADISIQAIYFFTRLLIKVGHETEKNTIVVCLHEV